MAIEIDMGHFQELVKIQKERQLAMKELSDALGIDISFSDDEVMKYALEAYEAKINKEISKEVEKWMKSLFS